jgi:hypothetical protein
MTKDEITKALTTDGQPNGVTLEWDTDGKAATVTLKNGKSFELKNEEHYFLMRLENFFTIYGTELSVQNEQGNGYIKAMYHSHMVGCIWLFS